MAEDQNDSPAFRLRPRRAAPKSYYTVRLEYSANPAAFIRERPRSNNKRKVFTQKTGSNSTKTASTQNHDGYNPKPNIVTKEEREREERRMLLHRDISQSITTDTMISPFIQRLPLRELEPGKVYEHNYISMRVREVDPTTGNGKILCCTCESLEEPKLIINVVLYDEYANESLIVPGKIVSIAKFKTDEHFGEEDDGDDTIPFSVIVKCDELVERATSNSNKGSPSLPGSSLSGASVTRCSLIPFVSITDMIEQPTEPFVEMSNSG